MPAPAETSKDPGDGSNHKRETSDSYMNLGGSSSSGPENGSSVSGERKESGSPQFPTTPSILSRSQSYASMTQDADDMTELPPLDRLTVFDFLENLALPQRLERLQNSISAQTERVRKQQQRLKSSSKLAREKVVDEWRKRVPPPDEQLSKYRRRMRESVDRLGKRWTDVKNVTLREKVSFIAAVLNIFISGYLIGGFPQYFHLWYSAQVAYYYPIRFITYRRRGYHYFLADLCYFVNLLLILSIWVFPNSKRLFISTFCLAYGNNAVAIAMWRNSLVFHSLDKVTSLFIHIMPCATLHCLVHLIPTSLQASRFPGLYSILASDPNSPIHYSLVSMALWSSIPYGFWQLNYHFWITSRRREEIAAGRPTSFTWLRRSYSKTWIGKFVLSLPGWLQEPAFMMIQYFYALLTMVPAPLWFWSRYASAAFLMVVFTWSIYNGATYYIDVFGTRFQRELEQLKKDVARWQMSPDISAASPSFGGRTPSVDGAAPGVASSHNMQFLSLGDSMINGDSGGSFPPTPGVAPQAHKSDAQDWQGTPGIVPPTSRTDVAAATGVEHDANALDASEVKNRAG